MMSTAKRKSREKLPKRRLTKVHQPVKEKEIDEDASAYAEDCDREMYGDDYEHLRDSGWLDR